LIIGAIKTSKWHLDLSDMDDICSHGNDLLSNCHECNEEQVKDTWICDICGKSTYDVEYDYIGSEYNHLSCELKIEMENKENNANHYVGHDLGGSYEIKKEPVQTLDDGGGITYREKDWLEKKLQYEIFKSNKKYEQDDADYYIGPDNDDI